MGSPLLLLPIHRREASCHRPTGPTGRRRRATRALASLSLPPGDRRRGCRSAAARGGPAAEGAGLARCEPPHADGRIEETVRPGRTSEEEVAPVVYFAANGDFVTLRGNGPFRPDGRRMPQRPRNKQTEKTGKCEGERGTAPGAAPSRCFDLPSSWTVFRSRLPILFFSGALRRAFTRRAPAG